MAYFMVKGSVGWGEGIRAGEEMNMNVHIYSENDYLLEHSLIVFFIIHSVHIPLFIEFKQTH